MTLTWLDWLVIAAYFALNLAIGLYYARRARGSTTDFFLSGRNVPWWLAGTSMVATTFAADTPLVVTGLVARYGIAGNWLWWSMAASGMLTVFVYARLWRRSGVMTDVEFAELRYAGKPAAFLRGFRALYLGIPINCIIIGWVNLAMMKILQMTLGLDQHQTLMALLALLLFTAFYTTLAGLWGVLVTDLVQFVLKMGMVTALAFFAVRAVGGLAALEDEDRRARRAGPLGSQGGRVAPRLLSGGRFRLDAGGDALRLSRRELVGQLVSGSGAGRRRLRRAADFLRPYGARRPVRDALVQHRALRGAALAVDPDRACVHRPVPDPRRQGVRLRADADGSQRVSAGAARHHAGRVRRGVHVHHRHAAQLGRVVRRERLLPPLHPARSRGARICAGVADRDRAADARVDLGDAAPCVDRAGVEAADRHRRRHRNGAAAALVLVAHQCVVGSVRDVDGGDWRRCFCSSCSGGTAIARATSRTS